jgi:hypothetical protein
MCIKIDFLHSHQDIFSENCGVLSDDHGECFYRDMSGKEKRYWGEYSSSMLEDYYWTATRDSPGLVYKWHVKKQCI